MMKHYCQDREERLKWPCDSNHWQTLFGEKYYINKKPSLTLPTGRYFQLVCGA